jgi:hypothetical protein
VIETCWKKTYLIPSDSILRVISSMRSRRPGALRASSSVAGAGAMRGLSMTVATVPPNVGAEPSATLPLPSTFIFEASSSPSREALRRAAAGRLYRGVEQIGTDG